MAGIYSVAGEVKMIEQLKKIENGEKLKGLHYGNRLILPFRCHLLKVIVNGAVVTDLSSTKIGLEVIMHDNFMDVYFHGFDALTDKVQEHEAIKMIVVAEDEDIFDFETHKALGIYLQDKHEVVIEKLSEDILFIE